MNPTNYCPLTFRDRRLDPRVMAELGLLSGTVENDPR
jgi:hypothetical protein